MTYLFICIILDILLLAFMYKVIHLCEVEVWIWSYILLINLKIPYFIKKLMSININFIPKWINIKFLKVKLLVFANSGFYVIKLMRSQFVKHFFFFRKKNNNFFFSKTCNTTLKYERERLKFQCILLFQMSKITKMLIKKNFIRVIFFV